MSALEYLRTLHKRQYVRPWALAAPILVLVVALPLLRPLRSPDVYQMTSKELSRLASIEAIADNRTLAIEGTGFFKVLEARKRSDQSTPPDTFKHADSYFSDRAPVMAFLLSGPYWVMSKLGIAFTSPDGAGSSDPVLAIYLLTLLGVTLPVAGAAGLIYRMGRMLELKRPQRTLLALVVVFGSGLLTYSVVLNSHAPAAALVLAACACLIHITLSKTYRHPETWLMMSGFCAALAATIDLAAVVFLVGLVFVILVIRWKPSRRIAGILLYAVGTLPPLALHATLTIPTTGNVLPGFLHRPQHLGTIAASAADGGDDDLPAEDGWIHHTLESVEKILGALIGSRGLFSHFPVIGIGLLGIGVVLRRHWPATTKALAVLTLAGGGIVILGCVFLHADWTQAMFGPRWFVMFLPLTLFWAGAWLRRPHRPLIWTGAAVLLLFSIAVSLVGMTDPFVRAAPGQYTAAAALEHLVRPTPQRIRMSVAGE